MDVWKEVKELVKKKLMGKTSPSFQRNSWLNDKFLEPLV
jgi:hypothetical protein